MKQYGHVMETREALVEERHKLMRYWLLLGLHMGIVTACTLSPYQQVGGGAWTQQHTHTHRTWLFTILIAGMRCIVAACGWLHTWVMWEACRAGHLLVLT